MSTRKDAQVGGKRVLRELKLGCDDASRQALGTMLNK